MEIATTILNGLIDKHIPAEAITYQNGIPVINLAIIKGGKK